jgi:hypothetical protein
MPVPANFPWKAKTAPLIRVRGVDGEVVVEYACTVGQKREFALDVRDNDLFCSVWPGQWSSDLFAVSQEDVVEQYI